MMSKKIPVVLVNPRRGPLPHRNSSVSPALVLVTLSKAKFKEQRDAENWVRAHLNGKDPRVHAETKTGTAGSWVHFEDAINRLSQDLHDRILRGHLPPKSQRLAPGVIGYYVELAPGEMRREFLGPQRNPARRQKADYSSWEWDETGEIVGERLRQFTSDVDNVVRESGRMATETVPDAMKFGVVDCSIQKAQVYVNAIRAAKKVIERSGL